MFMKFIFIFIATTGLCLGLKVSNAEPQFIPGINDLPLMPGLVLKSETPVVFDTPGGRIIEVFAMGQPKASLIRFFYNETLPQLGWNASAVNEFKRERELLKIKISNDNFGRSVVRFYVVSSD